MAAAKRNKGKKKSIKEIMKSSWGGAIIIVMLFAGLLLFYPDNNLFTWLSAVKEIGQQKREIRQYQLEILQMQKRIDELTSDNDTLEMFAREHFHFAEPGEDVYLVD